MARQGLTTLNARPLSEPDVLRLDVTAAPKMPSLAKVSQRHHALARCLALGMSTSEAALSTGYDPVRVGQLKRDPLFQELMGFYREEATDVFRATAEALHGVTGEAIAALRERIEGSPEEITTKDLVEIAKLGADRSGHGPQTTQTQVHVDLRDRMARARERVVIEAEAA